MNAKKIAQDQWDKERIELCKLRDDAGLNNLSLAKIIGINHHLIYRVMKGETTPTVVTYFMIIKVLKQ